MEILVTQTLRPIKLAFLIKPNSKAAFSDAMEICSSLWGGKYFPILPVKTRFSKEFRIEYDCYQSPLEFYSGAIRNYDPDFLVAEDEFEVEFINKIKGDRKIISLNELKKSIEDGNTRFGIGLDQVLSTLKEKEFKYIRSDGVQLFLPKIKSRDLFCSTLFGNPKSKMITSHFDLEADYISSNKVSISNLNKFYNENFWFPLRTGTYQLESFGNSLWTGASAIYLIDHNRLNDLVTFWNLRALGWKILPIPIEHFEDDFFQTIIKEQFAEYASKNSIFDRITVLKSAGVAEETLKEIQEKLPKKTAVNGETQHVYSFQWWFPRYWLNGQSLSYDRAASSSIYSREETTLIQLDSHRIVISAIKSPFNWKYLNHNDPIYKIQVSHSYEDYEGRFAEVLPEMASLDLEIITRGSGFYQWRYSERGAFYLAKNSNSLITTYFPEAFRVFEQFFKNHGYQIRYSAIGKLGAELLRNMGGILGINLLMSNEALEILQLFENGNIISKNELFGRVSQYRKALRVETPKDFVKSLLSKKIVEFGCEVQCPVCNQRSFYTSMELKDVLHCLICRNSFRLPEHDPDSIKWSYRGVGPFSRNNKTDGLICVFLLLRFFKITMASTNGAISPLLSFEILKNKHAEMEVDLALFYKDIKRSLGKPDLVFCECKTNDSFEKKDVDRMRLLGKAFPGSILTFATLKEELDASEKQLIGNLCEFFRKGISERPINPVLVLTKNELSERFGMKALEKLNLVTHISFRDQLGHLADVTCQKYLDLELFSSIASKRFEEMMKKNREVANA